MFCNSRNSLKTPGNESKWAYIPCIHVRHRKVGSASKGWFSISSSMKLFFFFGRLWCLISCNLVFSVWDHSGNAWPFNDLLPGWLCQWCKRPWKSYVITWKGSSPCFTSPLSLSEGRLFGWFHDHRLEFLGFTISLRYYQTISPSFSLVQNVDLTCSEGIELVEIWGKIAMRRKQQSKATIIPVSSFRNP